ncbi:nucleotide sugar dehydrogenase [bacterium]|jgi:UDP-N-acetyl-D-mannosaminuronic acid dehydrogenase|nr:nucleotide sugar dehydrogenase [bacterium]
MIIKDLYKIAIIASPADSIDYVVRQMAKKSRKVDHPGLAVILNKDNVILGVITDGDIRRAYASNVSFSNPVSEIMTKNPIIISSDIPKDKVAKEVIRMVQLNGMHNSESVHHVLLSDDNGRLIDIVNFLDTLQGQNGVVKKVAIFGMGYVGLTLAVSLANKGHQVLGLDIDKDLIKELNKGKPHVHEVGLMDMLKINIHHKKISFAIDIGGVNHGVYIVAVGTPLDSNGKPSLSALNDVLEIISSVLKKGDQVVLRSTVPVGTTREIVIPYLELKSGLKAGTDFYVTFAPERTIEGNAMHELKSLPQVLGGFSSSCVKYGSEFWSTLTPSIVHMASLEASELVKLANNTFRDVSFAFANELALLADRYNVDAFDLIHGANEGYPRNKIPLPSPGVGGYCLTKDPILFSSTSDGAREDAVLGLSSRKINEQAALYPLKVLKRFSKKISVPLDKMIVMVIGVAFKGVPETTDVRGSVAVELLYLLKKTVSKVIGWDAVIENKELEFIGFETVDNFSEGIEQAHVVLILNNHTQNIRSELYSRPTKHRLIFDGWKQLDASEIKNIDGLYYGTMGYIS